MKQMGLTTRMYLQDYDETWFPAWHNRPEGNGHWFFRISPYIKSGTGDWDGNTWDWTKNQGYGQVRYRHNMTTSFVFADGHAKVIRRGMVKVPYNWSITGKDENDWSR